MDTGGKLCISTPGHRRWRCWHWMCFDAPFSTLFMTVNTFGKPWIFTPAYRHWRCWHWMCFDAPFSNLFMTQSFWLWTLLGSHGYPHQLTDVGGVHTGVAMPFSTLFMTVNTFGKPWISTPSYRCWRCSHRSCYAIFLSLCDKMNGGIKIPIQRHPLNRPSP